MTDFVDAAYSVLAAAQQKLEIAAQNVSNMNTAGYRRRVAFEQMLSPETQAPDFAGGPTVSAAIDFTPGKQSRTGNPYDLAIAGPGFFTVADPVSGRLYYTRNGQFHRDEAGRIVGLDGDVLQGSSGALEVRTDRFQVADDGAVTEEGEPVGQVALADFVDRSQVEAAANGLLVTSQANVTTVSRPSVRQGALESSNVSTSEEMVAVMASLRGAEAGQRLINVYDDLMGRVVTTLGQS